MLALTGFGANDMFEGFRGQPDSFLLVCPKKLGLPEESESV